MVASRKYTQSEWDAGRMEGPDGKISVYIGEPLYKMEFHAFVKISMCFAAQERFLRIEDIASSLDIALSKEDFERMKQDADAVRKQQ